MYEAICDANGWDRSVLSQVKELTREIDSKKTSGTLGDEHVSRDLDDIRRTYELYPQQWIDEGSIVGSAQVCVDKMFERFNAGADGILLHGSTPAHLGPVVTEWARRRPANRFSGRSANPGL
jgi:hypothetical protein